MTTESTRPSRPSSSRIPVASFVPIFSVAVLIGVSAVLLYQHSIHAWVDPAPMDRILGNAPFIKTPRRVVDEMLDLARVTQDDLVYDLGCGDGRIVVEAAQKRGCKALGVDIDPKRVAEARENAKNAGVEHLVRIEEQDVFKLDLQEATVVMIYLLPHMNERLIPQLQKLRPGSRIVTHDFGIEGYKPDKLVTCQEGLNTHYLFFWEGPLPAERTAPIINRYLPRGRPK